MRRLPVFEFNKDKFRTGQRDAFDETVLRIQQRREPHTAIVIPTRYGKSDFMRMTGLHLLHEGAVSGVLVMTPNRMLRNQMVDRQKLRKSFSLYQTRLERINTKGERSKGISRYNVAESPKIEMMVDSEIVTATTSMVSHNLSTFRHWIDYLMEKYDEAHTASNRSAWGKTIASLADAGAYIVLCTATPYRTDGQPIPGFEVETISVESLQGSLRLGAHIYQRQGQRVVYRLVAHHVTTFQQAWQESVLCQVSRESFDVDLREHGMDGYEDHMLSTLSESSSRRALYTAVREPAVIREGVRRLVRNLRYRRRDAPETAGIVFVGSDDGSDFDDEQDGVSDQQANQYANLVQQILREEAPELKCVIATSKVDGDPAKAIEEFARGPRGGDVLVVKMMASAGLDIDRLKVALDLSTVRTPVSFVQRVMRICTRWERDEGEPVLRATYITPDECRGRELFDNLIRDLGGATATIVWDEETGEPIEEPYTPPVPVPLTLWEARGTEEGEYLIDSDGTTAAGSTLPYVDAIYEENPALSRILAKAILGGAIEKMAKLYARDNLAGSAGTVEQGANGSVGPPPPETEEAAYGNFIDDVQGRMEVLRENIHREVKSKAARPLRQVYNGKTLPRGVLGTAIQQKWVWLYRRAHIPWTQGVGPGQRLRTLNEDQLQLMWRILKEEA